MQEGDSGGTVLRVFSNGDFPEEIPPTSRYEFPYGKPQ